MVRVVTLIKFVRDVVKDTADLRREALRRYPHLGS